MKKSEFKKAWQQARISSQHEINTGSNLNKKIAYKLLIIRDTFNLIDNHLFKSLVKCTITKTEIKLNVKNRTFEIHGRINKIFPMSHIRASK